MKTFFILFFIFITTNCYAERVIFRKGTNEFITMQSGYINDFIDTSNISDNQKEAYVNKIKEERIMSLKKEVYVQGLTDDQIEFKEITPQEWAIIEENQILKPAREKAALLKQQEEQVLAQAKLAEKERLKQELKNEILQELRNQGVIQ